MTVSFNGDKEKIEITRETFDNITAGELEKTILLVNEMLDKKGLTMANDIDEIILVGGSTYMPQVQQKLEQVYGKPISSYEPNKAVAMGAALVADGASINNNAKSGNMVALGGDGGINVNDINVVEICTKSYGVAATNRDTGQEFVANIIFKDSIKPAHQEREFVTSCANQHALNLRVYENDSLEENATIEESELNYESCEVMLTPGLPENAPINIIFDSDGDQVLTVTAVDLTNNKPTVVKPVRIGGEVAKAGMDAVKKAVLT